MSMQGINNASNNRIHELGGIKLSKLCIRTIGLFLKLDRFKTL